MKVIRVVEFASGAPCPIAGQYLEKFSFEAYDGGGYGVFTTDVDRAMKFDSAAAALRFWRTQSRVRPLRPDGKPNRPFTATTIEILEAGACNS
jgi:hypothetical protein